MMVQHSRRPSSPPAWPVPAICTMGMQTTVECSKVVSVSQATISAINQNMSPHTCKRILLHSAPPAAQLRLSPLNTRTYPQLNVRLCFDKRAACRSYHWPHAAGTFPSLQMQTSVAAACRRLTPGMQRLLPRCHSCLALVSFVCRQAVRSPELPCAPLCLLRLAWPSQLFGQAALFVSCAWAAFGLSRRPSLWVDSSMLCSVSAGL